MAPASRVGTLPNEIPKENPRELGPSKYKSTWPRQSIVDYLERCDHAKADAITTEVIVENNLTTRLVTTSRITFAESGNSVLLSRAISQLVIEKH